MQNIPLLTAVNMKNKIICQVLVLRFFVLFIDLFIYNAIAPKSEIPVYFNETNTQTHTHTNKTIGDRGN